MKTVAVVGGSGFIGSHIVRLLESRGLTARVLGRGAAGVQYDPAHMESLRAAVRGCDAVIFLPGILHGRPDDFDEVHVRLPQRVMDACRLEGVRRYLHMSALGADPGGPSHYLRSKGRAEVAVRDSDLQWTVFRPSVVFGRGDHFVTLFAGMTRWLPVLPLAGAHARFAPVWVEDVAHAFVASLDLEDTVGQTLDLVGPDIFTLADIVRLCARLQGRHVLVIPLAPALARLQATVMECLPGPLMSRDNLDSMRVDNISSRDYPDLFGRQPASLEDIAATYAGRQ